jgi:sialic acid synthase SpsE
VGLSDHTADPLTGALAVALGAKWVEAHVRLSDTDPANPDFPAALGPGGAKLYVANVRKAEAMLGRGDKRPDPAEAAMLKYRVAPPG